MKTNVMSAVTEAVFAKAMEFHHWRCNASVVRTLFNESGRTIDWIEDHGIEIEGIRTVYPPEKSLQVWHIIKGSGARVVKMLSEGVKKRGGLILTKTPAKELTISDKAAVSGVSAENENGDAVSVSAKAVIIATGGFAGNREMLERYVPDVGMPGMAKLMYRGPVNDGRAGDGINMALNANASLAGMQAIAGNSPYLDHEPAISQFRGPEHLIKFDTESGPYFALKGLRTYF